MVLTKNAGSDTIEVRSLKFNDADILSNKGKVTAKIAKIFIESEF